MRKSDRPLWAPWRIAFIRSKKSGGCFLCGNEAPSDTFESSLVIHRGKKVFAILNRYPYNSGHIMVAPYRHVGDISKLPKDELHEIMDLSVEAKNVMDKLMRPDGFNMGFNLGLSAGAGVADHLHFHIVPRWNGDTNFMPVLGGPRVVPEALQDTADLLRKAWAKK